MWPMRLKCQGGDLKRELKRELKKELKRELKKELKRGSRESSTWELKRGSREAQERLKRGSRESSRKSSRESSRKSSREKLLRDAFKDKRAFLFGTPCRFLWVTSSQVRRKTKHGDVGYTVKNRNCSPFNAFSVYGIIGSSLDGDQIRLSISLFTGMTSIMMHFYVKYWNTSIILCMD